MENVGKTILLKDEDGNEIEFEVITKLDIEKDEYVIVVPKQHEDKDEAIALKIKKDSNNEHIFVTVDDEEEFNRVCEAYEILFSDGEVD